MADQANKRALLDKLASILSRLSDVTEKRREIARVNPDDPLLDEYDKQRLALANEADALLQSNPELATEKQHSDLAHAFDGTGEKNKARRHWEESVRKSVDRARENLQWFGRFLLLPPQNEHDEGRKKFKEALTYCKDERQRAMTYAFWFSTECAAGNSGPKVDELRSEALNAQARCEPVTQTELQAEFERFKHWKKS